MIYTKENAREKIVSRIRASLLGQMDEKRIRWPGFPPVNIADNKNLYINVDIVYNDSMPVGLGQKAPQRRMGTIVVEVNYKEGSSEDLKKKDQLVELANTALNRTDEMYPVRTWESRFVSPPSGVQQGWLREGVVTPFYYDTSR